jgi:MATE family multidrug resistance protein
VFSIAIVGMGLVLGTEPVIAQALGAKDPARGRRAFRQGVWLSLFATPVILACIAIAYLALPYTGVDEDVIEPCRFYMLARMPSILPFLLYWSGKAWLQAHGRTRAPVAGVVLGIVLELVLDSVLVPEYGVVGAGLANSLTSTLRLVVVVVAAELALQDEVVAGEAAPESFAERARRMLVALDPRELVTIARIGLPLGLQMALEVAVFAFAAVAMGRLGGKALAAHQVALQCASTTFNLMVGLGSAASVVVGRRIGARDRTGALRAGATALGKASLAMLATGALFFFGGAFLARLLTDKADVVEGAAALLAVAAAFQVSDGLQGVASGALRGAGDTRATFIIHLVSHWAVGMPCVVLLAGKLGASGVWWGLTFGLTAAAAALVSRFFVKARRGYEPISTTTTAH